MSLDDPQHCAAIVLGFYGKDGGYSPGSFEECMMQAFDGADSENFKKLSAAYPYLGTCMAMYKYVTDGVQYLQHIPAGSFPWLRVAERIGYEAANMLLVDCIEEQATNVPLEEED